MNSYGIYKTACEIIQQAMRDWGYECQGGVEFINYVEGVLTLITPVSHCLLDDLTSCFVDTITIHS